MKIAGLKISSGPNIYWYVAMILFIALGGWKGLLIWLAINLFFVGLAIAAHKLFFNKNC